MLMEENSDEYTPLDLMFDLQQYVTDQGKDYFDGAVFMNTVLDNFRNSRGTYHPYLKITSAI